MEINKSSRHSKITGNFAESLVLYWLSKYGFECALVDHTGLDVIARNSHTNELMGISVKPGRETREQKDSTSTFRMITFLSLDAARVGRNNQRALRRMFTKHGAMRYAYYTL